MRTKYKGNNAKKKMFPIQKSDQKSSAVRVSISTSHDYQKTQTSPPHWIIFYVSAAL